MSDVQSSVAFGLMTDEVTDISTEKHLALACRYVNEDGEVAVAYLNDTTIPEGTADTITKEITKTLDDLNLEISKLTSFASDGAATFTGSKNGVCKQLQKINTKLITNHCRDHRLALACKDSWKGLSIMEKTDDLLQNIYKYYKYSHVHTEQLKTVQKVMKEANLVIKQAKHHRWLSQSSC